MSEKQCKGCGEIKGREEFYTRSNDKQPFTHCKKCVKDQRKEQYWTDDKLRRRKQDKARARYWINKNANS